MTTTIDDDRFGRDLYVPLDETEELRVTPTGDLPDLTGYANLRGAIRARAVTSPGELLHRATYGAGLVDEVEAPNTPTGRARVSNALRRNLLADTRLGEVSVSVQIGTPGDASAVDTITATISARPRGDDVAIPITVTAR